MDLNSQGYYFLLKNTLTGSCFGFLYELLKNIDAYFHSGKFHIFQVVTFIYNQQNYKLDL